MGERRNIVVPECDSAMSHRAMSSRSHLSALMSVVSLFQGLPGMLVSGQVLLFVVLLLGGAMSVRGDVV
jgi:hypothetical protein